MMLSYWMLVTSVLYSAESLRMDCKWTHVDLVVIVDCSRRGLRFIPRLNDSVIKLDLSHNEIAEVSGISLPKNLKFLDFSWNKFKALNGSSFAALTELRYLDISHCKLRDVEKGVFGELYNLQYLNISYNRELGFASLPNITFNLNQTKIASLDLDGINCATGIGTIIKRHHLRNIQMTSLKKLSLASNRLELFETGVLSNLPKTLQIFSTAENKLTSGAYLLEFPSLPEVKVYNRSFQFHPPKYPESMVDQCEEKLDENFKNQDVRMTSAKSEFNWSLPLPPKLEIFYAQSSRLYLEDPTFSVNAPNLRHLYFQNNFIMSLKRPIHATNNSIETLDLSNNLMSHIFQMNDLQYLKHLDLSHNVLGQDFEEDIDGKICRTFTSLQVLDISFNEIISLPKLFLKNSNNLKYINASGNRLSSWIVDIETMFNLTDLDLSENKLATLNADTRSQFERAFQRSNMTINLSENGLACTCENQVFMYWIQKHQNHFRNIDNYFCSAKDITFSFKNLESSIDKLRKQCASYLFLYIGSAVSLAVIFSLIIGFILVKNRWKIRYMIYKTKQRFGQKAHFKQISTNVNYEHDAFISYSGLQLRYVVDEVLPRLEDERNLKLWIKDRDFDVGLCKVDNIMNGIQESKRTICLISKKYLESSWRDYELNMAKVEGIEDRGNLNYVILILLPEVYKDMHAFPNKIKDLIDRECHIEYPNEPCGYDDFWDRLAQKIEN
uniref:Toll-like receptor 6 n=1 Tax=Crassostrea virginica TaxID=6565 RepID=A0A8B8AJ57_CRAVI|nr:toll-like receptor 6 [Crassostrea virginica]XP_022291573.1 toll-like receptor 6 [Crassostrea virginica]